MLQVLLFRDFPKQKTYEAEQFQQTRSIFAQTRRRTEKVNFLRGQLTQQSFKSRKNDTLEKI